MWKIPRVWFYCRSVVHLRVLADALEELHLDRRLSVPWRVVLTFSDGDNADTTFSPAPGSLAPGPAASRPLLPALQRDVNTIAGPLRDVVFDEARKLSRNAGSGAGSGAGGYGSPRSRSPAQAKWLPDRGPVSALGGGNRPGPQPRQGLNWHPSREHSG